MANRKRAHSQPKAKSEPTALVSKHESPEVAKAIGDRLTAAIPEPDCELRFDDPFQLLISTILSAQSTDKTVNAVTPELFARFPTAAALAESNAEEVEALIKRTGFFRAKTKSIRGAAQTLVDAFGGEVPRSLEELVRLPGVARKTANVVLGTAFGIPAGFVVDTHVARVAKRLGLSDASDPGKIERALCEQLPRERWIDLGHRILLHGRYTCLAKTPKCQVCPLFELCPSRLGPAPVESVEERCAAEAERVQSGMASQTTAPRVRPLRLPSGGLPSR